MPIYTYSCAKCNSIFEECMSIEKYGKTKTHRCPKCQSAKTRREHLIDAQTINGNVKKTDSELKTIGDLANRNRDQMTEDNKEALWQKHNSYKDVVPDRPLPDGMSRIKKPKKVKWRPAK